jgi:uncharacterized metal-binding protein
MVSGCGGNGDKLIFTCAGAAYCGQVANRAGVQLSELGIGQLFCLAAIGGHVPAKLERTRNAEMRIAIDGCEDQCARRMLERADMPANIRVVLTELGIEMKPAQPMLIRDTKKVIDWVESTVMG